MPSWLMSSKGPYNVAAQYVEGATQSYGAKLQPPSYEEIDAIADIFQSLNEKSYVLSYNVGFYDRTAFVSFVDVDFVCQTFVETLRRRLAEVNLQWRIVIQGKTNQDCVTVYPSKIVLHGRTTLDSALTRIRNFLVEHKASTEGVLQRQFDHVASILPSFVETFDFNELFSPQIIAAFDRSPRDTSCYGVWVLEPGYPHQNKSWIPDDDFGDGFQGVSGSTTFDVTKTGKLVPYLEAGKEFVGAINGLAYDKKKLRNKLIFQHPTNGTRHEIPFVAAKVIQMVDSIGRVSSPDGIRNCVAH